MCGPLVVAAGGDDHTDVDWTSLSRKHEIEVDAARQAITIFGGKLTDCLNVGEEVADAVESLGLPLEPDHHNWYGEPTAETRAEFYRQARLMRLDDLRQRPDVEPLSDRLWRRYGRRAFAMLEAIRDDPTMGEDIMGGDRLPPGGAAPRGEHRDGDPARGLHAATLEDRTGRARRRARRLGGAARRCAASSSATGPTRSSPSTWRAGPARRDRPEALQRSVRPVLLVGGVRS